MISRGILLAISLVLFPVFVSGEELLVQVLESKKGFESVKNVELVHSESDRSFYRIENEGVLYWVISEETATKSGALTYTALLDNSLKIINFVIPSYENKHNASLTSAAFLRQFRKEKPAEEPIQIGYGVDAISGATSSTLSLVDAVNASVLDLKEIQNRL